MKWRWVIILVLIGCALGAFYLWRRAQAAQNSGSSYQTVEIERGDLVVMVNAAGSISAGRETDLVFGTSGRVSEVLVEAGDVVAAGQVLVRLDPIDLELSVAKARLSFASAENQLRKLLADSTEADLAAALASVKSAEESLARVIAGATEAEEAAVLASVKSAEENLARVIAGPTEAEIAVAEAALASAQEAYQRLLNGPDADEIEQAKLSLDKAKNSLWSAQMSRDAKGNPGSKASGAYDQAQASVANAEISVRLAEMALAELKEPATAAEIQDMAAKVEQARQNLQDLLDGPTAAEIASAESQLAQAEAKLDDLDGPSAAEIASAESQLASAQAKLDDLLRGPSEEDIAISEAQVEQARLSLEQAEKQLESAALVAAYDGVILDLNVGEGEGVGATMVVAVLADLSTLEIVAPLSELDVVSVQEGQMVTVQLDALPEVHLRGQVVLVAPAAQIAQGVANYATTIVVNDPSGMVRPGMSANMYIITDRRQDVLVAPNRAVRSQGQQRVVAVLKGTELEWVPLETGAYNDTMTEIVSGLDEGQEIVANPPNPASQQPRGMGGMRVAPGMGGGFPH
ncbi:MAG: HlyD family efflux transporter periplasmic adaptor subunit [Anaerolineales bacterium]|nr:MAG: HlyD family efflux transporter periplasmic adaptor subunit [Anaerolineales bacterium]